MCASSSRGLVFFLCREDEVLDTLNLGPGDSADVGGAGVVLEPGALVRRIRVLTLVSLQGAGRTLAAAPLLLSSLLLLSLHLLGRKIAGLECLSALYVRARESIPLKVHEGRSFQEGAEVSLGWDGCSLKKNALR